MRQQIENVLDSAAISHEAKVSELLKLLSTKRRHLPDTRQGTTKRFRCGDLELYLTIGWHPDEAEHEPAEIFVRTAKEGSTMQGMVNGFCLVTSIALQYGVPWQKLEDHLRHTHFEPADANFTSLLDAIAKKVREASDERRELWSSE